MAGLDRRALLRAGAAAAALPLVGSSVLAQSPPPQVGFVLLGEVGEYGWSHAHDAARRALKAELGDAVRVLSIPGVSEDSSAIPVIRDMAQQGCELIFATAAGYSQQVGKVAAEFPHIRFEQCGGGVTAGNVATYDARFHEGKAVAGTIAGLMSRSGTLGYLATYRLPEVVLGANAFLLAAQKHNPEARLHITFIDSWFDPPAEIAATEQLIDLGADIVATHTDSPAALQTLERHGLHGFGQGSDLSAYAPNAQLTAIQYAWGPYYIERTRAFLDGTWTAASHWLGLRDGAVGIAPYGVAVPAEAVAAAEAVKAGIMAGTYDIFTGPIYDQTGNLRVPEGEVMSAGELAGIDWFVRGVEIAGQAT